MKKLLFILSLALLWASFSYRSTNAVTSNLYFLPIEKVGSHRGPEYFAWRFDQNGPSITAQWSLLDYGFLDEGLLYSPDISDPDHAALILNADVYAFNLAALDAVITDKPVLDVILEGANIPTNWITPATTYRVLLRNMYGLFAFNQRYATISDGGTFLGGGITLDSHWNDLTVQQRQYAIDTALSLGIPFSVQGNPLLRVVARQIA